MHTRDGHEHASAHNDRASSRASRRLLQSRTGLGALGGMNEWSEVSVKLWDQSQGWVKGRAWKSNEGGRYMVVCCLSLSLVQCTSTTVRWLKVNVA